MYFFLFKIVGILSFYKIVKIKEKAHIMLDHKYVNRILENEYFDTK